MTLFLTGKTDFSQIRFRLLLKRSPLAMSRMDTGQMWEISKSTDRRLDCLDGKLRRDAFSGRIMGGLPLMLFCR